MLTNDVVSFEQPNPAFQNLFLTYADILLKVHALTFRFGIHVLFIYLFIYSKFHDKYIYIHIVELQWLEHRWLVYHGYFEHILGSLTYKIQKPADITVFGIFRVIFFYF